MSIAVKYNGGRMKFLGIISLLFLVGCLDGGIKSLSGSSTSQSCLPSCPSDDAISVKTFGAKGDGVTDDTKSIQDTIDSLPATGGTVYVPAGKYMIDATKSIALKSNMHFQMDTNATLAAIPNGVERYYILSLAGVTDVEVSGGRLLGERDQHTGTTGEWGYGINVGKKSLSGVVAPNASSNIYIHDIHISKLWGDGLQVGGTSSNIEIRRVVSTMNRRRGLSITQAQNVRVYDSEFSYTEGTAPQYGIDIEPDPVNAYFAKDIIIENCNFLHNKGGGVMAYKETSNVIIRKNNFEYNTYGIYTVDSSSGLITENTFAHNKYQGIALSGSTQTYEIGNNIFRNNNVNLHGITNNTNPLAEITGTVAGSSGTGAHLVLGSETLNNTVLTNQYAK